MCVYNSILYMIHIQNWFDYNISLLAGCLASLSSALHSATFRSSASFFCWSSRIIFLHSISSLFLARRLSNTALGLPVLATSSESVVSELLCWRELMSADAPFFPKRFSVRVRDVSILHERRMWLWCTCVNASSKNGTLVTLTLLNCIKPFHSRHNL